MAEKDKQLFDPSTARNQAGDVLMKIAATKIEDEDSWYQFREWRRMAKLLDKEAKNHYAKVKKPMNEAIAEIRDMESKDREPMERIMEIADPNIIAYEEQREIEREKQQSKLEAEAMERAQAQREQKIKDLEAAGKMDQANALRNAPLSIPPVILPPVFSPLDGEGRKVTWGISETEIDLDQLIAAVVAGQLPRTVLEPSIPTLNKMAQAIKTSGKIPGCKIVPFISITQR